MNAPLQLPLIPSDDSPPIEPAELVPATSTDFDWRTDADSIVVEHQPSIAVYRNGRNAVVIRQEGQYHPDEDHWVMLSSPDALRLLIAALQRELKEW